MQLLGPAEATLLFLRGVSSHDLRSTYPVLSQSFIYSAT